MTTTTIEIESLSGATNNAVLRLSGRRYPGILVQGDNLAELHRLAARIVRLVPEQSNPELVEAAADLLERLDEKLVFYETVLLTHGYDLPYPKDQTPLSTGGDL